MNTSSLLVGVLSFFLLIGSPGRAKLYFRPLTLLMLTLLATVLLIHVGLEGSHWQMWGAYVLALSAMISATLRLRSPSQAARPRGRVVRSLGCAVAASVTLLALLPAVALPVFSWPKPIGPYAVGVRDLLIVDRARTERHVVKGKPREILIRAWYPAVSSGSAPAPYMGVREARAFSALLQAGDPAGSGFLANHLAMVRTHGVTDARPVAGRRFPVLLFNHGFGGTIGQNTRLAEALAAKGYVVLSIGHPYGAAVLPYPDGRLVTIDAAALRPGEHDDDTARLFEAMETEVDPGRFNKLVDTILARGEPVFGPFMQEWTADIAFVADAVEAGRIGSGLDGFIDAEKLGAFGHSFGGAAAALFCSRDIRCRASINIDGLHYGPKPLSNGAPRLMIYMDSPNRGLLFNDRFYLGEPDPLVIQGTGHLDGTDLAMAVAPFVKRLMPPGGALGPNDGQKVAAALDRVVSAFFDQNLKGHSGLFARVRGTDPILISHSVRP